jgi:tellurite methyltransferase
MKWEDFYKKVAGREPRPLLNDVLQYFPAEQTQPPRQAIDLGCGDGTETAFMLKQGWQVLAIDGEPTAIDYLLTKVSISEKALLQTQTARFEDVSLLPADLIYASYSLPFCAPEHFDVLWKKIVDNLKPNGRFAGEFFGVRDTWADNPDMTFHTEEQLRTRLSPLEIEVFREHEDDGQSAVGPKHWHVFTVIAKKP